MSQQATPQEQQLRAALQQAAELVQKQKLALAAYHEPIAIVGMGCAYPGASDTPEQFWQNLLAGFDGIGDLPEQRIADMYGVSLHDLIAHAAQHSDTNQAPAYSLRGGFLPRVDEFDPAFFGLSPREVLVMDPTHRLLLETTWHALEDANVVPETIFNTDVGVFIGGGMSGYLQFCGSEEGNLYLATGNTSSTAAGRISYVLGITGPCVAIDTACSSSLTAVHLACQSLRNGECSAALAGGVNVIIEPNSTAMFAGGNMLSGEARCKTFDAAADGYVRGEGCGILVLKRLADARSAGDRIIAVIRGTAVNQDGPSGGLTVPNGPAQERVIRRALADAKLKPAQLGYIEAHGTGTPLGDPIEIGALSAVFGGRQQPLYVGSVKTNIGHLEMAAGVAGLMKLALAVQHGQIPPHLHLHTPNPHIDWAASPVQVPTSTVAWLPSAGDGVRIGGISSFGFSGTNAHVIVAQAPQEGQKTEDRAAVQARSAHLLTISAKSEQSLQAYVTRYLEFLAAHPDLDLGDLCYTSHVGRSHFAHRLSVAAPSVPALQQQLQAVATGATSGVSQGIFTLRQPTPKIAFLFTGQGSQYVEMGRELYTTSPTFRAALDRCEMLYREYTSESLLAVLYPEQKTEDRTQEPDLDEQAKIQNQKSKIDDTTYTQPALFALEYALATLWQSWGVQPDYLLGHSVGEVAAACVAGVFSLEDGMKLIAARGRLIGALPQDGAMIAVMASEAEVQRAIAPYADRVAIAAVNGSENVVISGQRDAVNAIAATLTAAAGDNAIQNQKSKIKNLTVSHAFHSPLMDPMLDAFRQVAESITYQAPRIPLIANVTGTLAGAEVTTPDYWVRHVRDAVRFADGIATLHTQGIDLCLEIGPKPTLLGMAQPLFDSASSPQFAETKNQKSKIQNPGMLPSLRPHQPDWQSLLASLGELYVHGVAIDWHGVDRDEQRHKIVLPVYPFLRQRFWPAATGSQPEAAETTDGFVAWLATHTIEQLTDLITERGQFTAADRPTVNKVLTLLDAEERNRQITAQIDALLYEVTWAAQPKPLPVIPPTTPGQWLLLSDKRGVGAALAAALQAVGETVTVIADETAVAEALTPLLTRSAEALPLRGILHLGGLNDGDAVDTVSSAELMAQQARNLGSVLELVQTLAATGGRGPQPRLWVITQGAQQLTPTEAVAVAQTPLWGLGRVIALEHRALWGGLIDLDGATSLQSVLAELLQVQPDGETQVAYRQGKRHVARLTRAVRPALDQATPIRPDATYLITGGLGALGLLVANWLAAQGAGQLILTGRRGITSADQQAAVQRLTARGSRVQIAQVDVADESAMGELFAQIAAGAFPLKGVFHTAGVLDDAILLNQRWARFAPVLAPKVTGAWLLHQLTQGLELDFLVFFSSTTALLGNLGQGNYAAANAFLDGLARYRQQQGLPGLSINWGAWAEVGMAARTVQDERATDQMIKPQLGIAVLARLLSQRGSGHSGQGAGQVAVVAVDWQHFAPDRQPFFANFVPQASAPATPSSSLRTALAARPKSEQIDLLRAHLQQVVGAVLGMVEPPDPTTGFADLGMDSLMALELRRRLEGDLSCTLPTTIAFEYPTVDELAAYLWQDVVATIAPAALLVASPARERTEGAVDEPIAVISMACRFPGADTPEEFWQLLAAGTDMVQAVPPSRWDVEAFYDPDRPTPGKMYMREAAFVDGVAQFDPLFFGIAPREAIGMDPHHRLLLEMSWEALERAGLAPSSLVDSPTGVFVGIGESDYPLVLQGANGLEADPYAVTSSGHSIAAGRLAYTLGLQGPTLAVDTACSSSLVALHLACQSLRSGECDLALAGGVNLMLTPFTHIALSQMQALSPDGRCKTFDAAADGYGRGEGGAMVLLKRLSDATRAGDTILAVIQGSAVNHDGHSSGLTVPNKRAQEKLLRQALAAAQVSPDQVSYIEAHGTGTALGDPIEIRALGAVFGAVRETPLLVGSVKTNIGHLEAAAGIAGFLKTVLALQHGQLPPHLHLNTPSPYIEWDEVAIQVPTTLQPWPGPRIAGISAFGLSGTNAHLIVTAPEGQKTEDGRAEDGERERPRHVLPLSAKSEAALPALAQRYLTYLQQQPDTEVADLCYTAAVGRSHLSQRVAVVAADRDDLQRKLAALAQGQPAIGVQQGTVGSTRPRLAFLFTGQGAQYVNMGRELYETQPTFRATLNRCEALYQQYTGESLLAVLYPEQTAEDSAQVPGLDAQSKIKNQKSKIDDTTYTQPALFALEYALATLWQSWGVQPAILIGHSVGEVAAACVAGVFSLEDGIKLIAARGRLMGALPQDGAMIAVTATVEEVAQAIAPYADRVAIAAVNGPTSIVISGQRAAVNAVAAILTAEDSQDDTGSTIHNPQSKIKNLTVSHAFHSPLMDPMLEDFRRVAQTITYHAPQLRLVSNVTGQVADTEMMAADYWVRHVREAVRFADGIATLGAESCTLFLEIGPKPTLLNLAEQVLDTVTGWQGDKVTASPLHPLTPSPSHPVMLPSLRPAQPDWQQMLESLSVLYVQGVAIDWNGFDQAYARRKVLLPTYPFQRQLYWPAHKEGQSAETANGFAEWLATHDITALTDRIIARLTTATNGHAGLADERTLVTQVLRALEAEQRAQQMTAQVEALLYELAWERQPQPAALLPPPTPGRWLILADGRGVGTALATALEALGETVDRLPSGAEPALITTALTGAARADCPLRGVLHCWGLDDEPSDMSAALMARQQQNLGSVLQLVQTLATGSGGPPPRLWIITQGAQPLTPTEPIALTQTPLWGLGRVIALEHGELWGGLLDIDAATSPQTLLTEILHLRQHGETQVAYRQGTRHVARLVRRRHRGPAPTPVAIDQDAAYLITGGLGALGLLVADWLAAQGARHLVLTGRRGITTPQQQEAINRLTANDIDVQLAQVDVTDDSAMRALFAQMAASAFPLKGVFHTAGVLDDAILLNQRWERFAPVLASKVTGAWLLHHLTQELPLDFMIFFSSAAALLGSMGQGNYAAANAFLDGLAHYRQQQGLPALSIHWGAWAEVGMAARTVQSALAPDHLLTPQLGLTTLAHLLADAGQVGVLSIDWTALAPSSYQPFLANFMPSPAAAPSAQTTLVATLTGLPANQRLAQLRAHVHQTVATILGMSELPARDSGFADLGMDSLMALALRRRLETDLGSPLPTTLAFEYPTVDALATYLLNEVLTLTAPAGTQQPSPTANADRQRTIGVDEPIAVISMACRFPGADTPEAFWQLLHDGVDMVRTMPATRWDVEAFYDPQRPTPGKMYMREAAFVDGVEEFDPLFFGIAPREAIGMDPQHRLLLEVSWEALERAGLAPSSLVDSPTGVFVGIGASEYGVMSGLNALAGQEAHAATSSGHSIAAGRLAYTLGLQGPTLAVDTACSSSLVALHLACQSLRSGECDLALAGGVNLMLTPFTHIALSQMQALAPDGRCKTFDAAADGYGRGEGGAMVLLKRLSDATRAGDTILAVIQGSAVNHDGHSSGLTVPNKRAQEKLLRQALAAAHVTPDDVSYIEAHGTGTALGDPIEIRALGAVFGAVRETPLLVGSVKTNIGHLEAAAGIAGFLKTVLALQHGQLPPHLHLQTPSPYIEWDEVAIQVPTALQPWPGPRIAGISAFGLSGTNAHLIVTGPEEQKTEDRRTEHQKTEEQETEDGGRERTRHVLTLSAKSEAALPTLAQRYLTYLQQQPDTEVADLCYTAAVGRNHFSQRMALVATDRTDLSAQLAAVAQEANTTALWRGVVFQNPPKLAFLFTGQGSQSVAMGRELYVTSPTFRTILDRCEALYQQYTGESLVAVLYAKARDTQHATRNTQHATRNTLDDTTYTQPALFALEVALAQIWQSWGVQPDYLLGHSVGEVAAACVAGVFSLEDGMKLIAARGRLMGALPQDGAMIAVTATETAVQQAIAPYADSVAIAAINGPTSIVISGQRDAVNAVATLLAEPNADDAIQNRAQGAPAKIKNLTVSHAFHSPLMDPMLDEFRQVAESITYHTPKLPLVSNVTGKLAGAEIMTADYWVRHVREAVRFADGITTLHEQGIDLFLEIGPKPTLLGMAQPILDSASSPQPAEIKNQKSKIKNPLMLPSLRPAQPDWQQMLESLGALYVQGVAIDWAAFDQDYARRKVALPTYPFQRQRYWLDAQPTPTAGWGRAQGGRLRPLIDKMIAAPALRATLFETALSVNALPFLADHRVYTMVVAPGACHLAMVLSAAELAYPGTPGSGQGYGLKMVVFPQPLALAETETRTAQVIFTPASVTGPGTQANFQLLSFTGTPDAADLQQLTHATGSVGATQTGETVTHAHALPLHTLQERCTVIIPATAATAENATGAEEAPIVFGPAFRWIEEIRHAPLEVVGEGRPAVDLLAKLRCPAALPSLTGYVVHPGLLDACFQVVGWGHQLAAQNTDLHLPFALDALQIYPMPSEKTPDHWWCHVTQREATKWDIQLFDSSGQRLIAIAGYEIRAAPQSALQSRAVRTDWLYALDWEAKPLPTEPGNAPDRDCWVLWGDAPQLRSALAQQLGAAGTPLFVVQSGAGPRPSASAALQQRVVDPTDGAAVSAIVAEITAKYRRVGLIYLGLSDETVAEAAVPANALVLSSGLLHLVQALSTVTTSVQLWLVTQGVQPLAQHGQTRQTFATAAAGTLWGLGRTIAQEQPQLHTVCIDLDQTATPATQAALLHAEIVSGAGTGEAQIVYQQQTRYVARLDHWQGLAAPTFSSEQQPMRLYLREYGSLDNLSFAPMVRRAPAAGEVEVAVKAVGLNFRDVLNTLGMLREYYATVLGIHRADEVALGFECAGVITAVGEGVTAWTVGDRVMGIVNGAFAGYVTVPAPALAKIPDHFTFAEAATIPLAFLTAWYGLKELAQLQAGERILIHAAAGGVGQAALQIAQASGAEVWATASPTKWAFLRSQGVDQLLNSRTLDFAEQIAQQTAGAGVDVIFNSLNGDFVEQSFAVLANQGRFVEIGKLGIWTPATAQQRRPDAAYYPFDLGEVLAQEPALYPRMWAALLDHFADGSFKPLPHKIFPAQQVVEAFRFMQQAKQIGKVVVSFEDAPRPAIQAAASYLITGGLGDLGLQMAQQLAAEGAKHLVLTGRRATVPETAQPMLAALAEAGVAVHVVQADVADRADVAHVLATCSEIAPLRGIIHAAGVLDDGLLAQQSVERFTRVLRPKVDGAWHLHTLTQEGEVAETLDFFVCFSSASSMLGAAGQSNYAAANAFMDTLMQQRAAAGLPGLSINWGPWADIGMAARLAAHHQKRLATGGIGTIKPSQGAQLFSVLLANAAYGGQIGVIPIRWEPTPGAVPTGFLERLIRSAPAATASQNQAAPALLAQLEKASAQECQRLFMAYLQEVVTKILRLPALPQPQQGLVDIGMDSLMAVELRSHVGNTFQISLAMTAFIDSSIEQLAIMLAEQWLLARLQAEITPQSGGTAAGALANQPAAQPKETDLADEVIEEFVL